jgi:hypothetical protein
MVTSEQENSVPSTESGYIAEVHHHSGLATFVHEGNEGLFAWLAENELKFMCQFCL